MQHFVYLLLILNACNWRNTQNDRPLSVCEALFDHINLNGKMVTILGEITATDEGKWVRQNSPKHLMTDSFKWQNSIWLSYDGEDTDIANDARIAPTVIREKIRSILGDKADKPIENPWVLVYGRFESYDKLIAGLMKDGVSVAYRGFGHLGTAPAQLVYRKNAFRYFSPDEVQDIINQK